MYLEKVLKIENGKKIQLLIPLETYGYLRATQVFRARTHGVKEVPKSAPDPQMCCKSGLWTNFDSNLRVQGTSLTPCTCKGP